MVTSLRSARHRASGHSRPLSLVLTASGIAAAVIGAVIVSGGTYALWSKSSTVAPATVSAGKLEFVTASSFDATQWSRLIQGESVRQSFTVTNSGDVKVALSATAVAASGFEIRLAPGPCTTSALTGAPATTSANALGTLAKGANTTLCLEVALTNAATAGQQVAFTVSLAGTQVL